MDFGTIASTSDALMMLAVVGYVAATALHGLELVWHKPARAASPVAAEPAMAMAGAGASPPGRPIAMPAAEIPRQQVWVGRYAGLVAAAVTVAAMAAHVGAVITRGAAAGRVPWGNMYEFILTLTLAGAVAWLVALARRPVRPVGLFVTLALALLLGGAGRVHVRVAPLVPALDSPWLKVHVAAAALSAGMLLVGFVAACLYVWRLRHDAAVAGGLTIASMPSAVVLDRLAFRMHAAAFPIWTFAIICGAVWAEAAWGRYWGWDPKETWAFISWVLYAAYLHARNTAGWRGRKAALIAIAGWVSMMINLFAVNMLVPSLHSYAGL